MTQETQYLKEVGEKIQDCLAIINELDEDSIEVDERVTHLLGEIVESEADLRVKYEIGARFSVIQGQLQELLKLCQGQRRTSEELQDPRMSVNVLTDDEELVYVYLFNTQGNRFHTWLQLLTTRALTDHSINRPIYGKKEHIEEFLRSKEGLDQHAYIKARVKKSDVLMSLQNSVLKDGLGNLLMRLKQGSLQPENILAFYHRGKEYTLSAEGELVLEHRPVG